MVSYSEVDANRKVDRLWDVLYMLDNTSKDPIGVVFAARLPLEGGRGCGVKGIGIMW